MQLILHFATSAVLSSAWTVYFRLSVLLWVSREESLLKWTEYNLLSKSNALAIVPKTA